MTKEKKLRLKRGFYERNTILVARDLLGKSLNFRNKDQEYKAKIVETEAYIGYKDDAAHFNKGLTNRTRIIDEVGGHIYIYNIYGMYQLFNIVTEAEGVHGAVLIRAIEPVENIEEMYKNRYKKDFENPAKREIINLTNGPAKFVMALGITKDEFYGVDLVKDDRIWIEDKEPIPREEIVRSKRINVDYAQKGKDYLLRFHIKNNPYVSKK